METLGSASNQTFGGANSYGGPQVVQSAFHGPVNFSHGANRTLPDRVSTLPRTVNRSLYTGRKEIADRLADAFKTETHLEQEGVRVFVIIGLGGTGKSEICLKYAEDNINQYWGRFWVDCSDHKIASECYKKLGHQCSWDVTEVDEIRWKLTSCGQRWLLVLDNADEPNFDLQDHIPPGGRGDVIVTSRNGECSEHATIGSEILEGLNDQLSRELLLKVAGIQSAASTIEAEEAMQVVKTLDHHTLALVQAGSYVKNGLCTLAEYPMLYAQRKKQLMSYVRLQRKSTYNSVFATFEVSAKWLERESRSESDEAQCSGDGLHLLHMLSFMDRNGPMQLIFAEAAQYAEGIEKPAHEDENNEWSVLALKSYHVEQLPAFAPRKWRGAIGHLRWREACNILKRFSLVKIIGTNQDEGISLHPLVHEWAKERQDPDVRQQAWISTACTLGLACGGQLRYAPIFKILQSHVRSCLGQNVDNYLYKMPRDAAWQVSFQLAWMLHISHEDRTLVVLLQAMYGLVQMEEENNLMLTATQYLFALSNLRERKVKEAIQLLEHVKQVEDSRRDETHRSRLAIAHTLARAYSRNEQNAEAIEMLEHVVQIKTLTLDEAHRSLLASQQELAAAYRANGQVAEAIRMLEHLVQIQASTLDEFRPSLLVSQHSLALAYADDGQWQRANAILDQVVRTSELKFGINHPHTELYRKTLQRVQTLPSK